MGLGGGGQGSCAQSSFPVTVVGPGISWIEGQHVLAQMLS